VLEVMSVAWEKNLLFEEDFLRSFGQRNGLKTEYLPNARLTLYQRLLHAHSSQPDLLEIDVVWPAILADDLVDLQPYLKEDLADFSSDLLASYTVNGRLVAIPLYVDLGVLYYRPELLRKYGFQRPPATWEELEAMALRIQQGERRTGNKDFWAYVWEGARYEGLTCNALEWQSSAGAGNFIEPGGVVHVRSPLLAAALRRAAHWMGTISPPAEYVYFSDDAMNIWDEGQTAFMRNWASSFSHVAERSAKANWSFAVAPLPKGPGGHRGALGGLGMGVSKYAANRQMAIKALLELTDERHDLARLMATNGIPTHLSVSRRTDVRERTSLLAVSAQLLQGLVARPSSMTGPNYDQVSREYAAAVNSVLRRTATPEAATAELEKRLLTLTGLRAEKN
jgi:trehalose/maltose transport system substrate-binding protein